MPQILQISRVDGSPPRVVALRIRIPTAKNPNFPADHQDVSDVTIQLPDKYPFPPGPTVVFDTPIWNPNVYESGRWCYGDWKITENLELFVIRLMKVIALDPSIVYPQSPANSAAAAWYQQIIRQRPNLFPTLSVTDAAVAEARHTMTWRTIK